MRNFSLTAAKTGVLTITAIIGMTIASPIQRQSAVPKWEAVSVKRCGADVEAGRRSEESETPRLKLSRID